MDSLPQNSHFVILYPQVAPNLNECPSYAEHKQYILKNVVNQTVDCSHWLPWYFFGSQAIHTGLEQLEGE